MDNEVKQLHRYICFLIAATEIRAMMMDIPVFDESGRLNNEIERQCGGKG